MTHNADNKTASELFLKVSQEILRSKGFPEAERFRKCGVSLEGQLAIADHFGLFGVIVTSEGHARLVQEAYEDGRLLVYDPIEQPNGRSKYELIPKNWGNGKARLGVTKALSKHCEIDGLIEGNPIAPDNILPSALLRVLDEKHYRMAMPSTQQLYGLQDDSQFVCGPLAVYAMAIANRYTPSFNDKVDFNRFERETGIEIV